MAAVMANGVSTAAALPVTYMNTCNVAVIDSMVPRFIRALYER